MSMVPPCTGYLTNISVTLPPSSCCEGFNGITHQLAGICYCHVANGDIQKLLPAPMNFTRMFAIPDLCGAFVGLHAFAEHCGEEGDGVPPMTLPPPPSPSAGN
ncbi:hypothetical protein BAE44_0026229 [Dichanthelium oligosanthes]|uniref:Bifunctional inhibitor/plant lipid transfer protein/seed storage helical domain-containing protein n=1 Tax=Dichanthelium oligosanthes TaxID=888268 RepID=A0A1E5UIN8_9POAL|nr:hypothetical protein BAE44_0026229 [Dichanthelium oligosanthes]